MDGSDSSIFIVRVSLGAVGVNRSAGGRNAQKTIMVMTFMRTSNQFISTILWIKSYYEKAGLIVFKILGTSGENLCLSPVSVLV